VTSLFKNCLKWLACMVCGEYGLYRIYEWPGVDNGINRKGENERSPVVLGTFRTLVNWKRLRTNSCAS
jgi:hypothetical protein